MKHLLSLTVLLLASMALHAQNFEKYAKKAMKRFGVEQNEIYSVSRKDFCLKYGKIDTQSASCDIAFPENYLYDNSGKRLHIESLKSGVTYQPLNCYQTFSADCGKLFDDTSTQERVKVMDSIDRSWDMANIKAVYTDGRSSDAQYHLYVYFPAGYAIIFKRFYPYYKELMTKVRHYQAEGKDIKLYFVLIPLK